MGRKRTPDDRGRWIAEWRLRYPEAWNFDMEWDDEVGIPVPVTRRDAMGRCGAKMKSGISCPASAGRGTIHKGVGRCVAHDTRVERAAAGWMVAHKIAQIMDVSPWEALLLAVRRAAAWANFYEGKLAEVENDDDLRPGGNAYVWLEALERVTEKLARWSKMAVDAGVAKMLVERASLEGAQIAQALNAAIEDAALDEAAELRLRTALRRALTTMADTRTLTASDVVGEAASVGDDVA